MFEVVSGGLVVCGWTPGDDWIAHTLFALKHEGIDLAILAEALPHLPAEALLEAIQSSPNGIYLRGLGYLLYEAFVRELLIESVICGRLLRDPKRYVTGPGGTSRPS